jgi:hypothetical protein
MIHLLSKQNVNRFDFQFAHSRFLGMGRVHSVPYPLSVFRVTLPTVLFCLVVILENSWFINLITRLKNSGSLSRQYRRSRPTSLQLAFCSVVSLFGTILVHTFVMPISPVKIWCTVNRFKCNSLLITINVNQRSDLTRGLTLSTMSFVF